MTMERITGGFSQDCDGKSVELVSTEKDSIAKLLQKDEQQCLNEHDLFKK